MFLSTPAPKSTGTEIQVLEGVNFNQANNLLTKVMEPVVGNIGNRKVPMNMFLRKAQVQVLCKPKVTFSPVAITNYVRSYTGYQIWSWLKLLPFTPSNNCNVTPYLMICEPMFIGTFHPVIRSLDNPANLDHGQRNTPHNSSMPKNRAYE